MDLQTTPPQPATRPEDQAAPGAVSAETPVPTASPDLSSSSATPMVDPAPTTSDTSAAHWDDVSMSPDVASNASSVDQPSSNAAPLSAEPVASAPTSDADTSAPTTWFQPNQTPELAAPDPVQPAVADVVNPGMQNMPAAPASTDSFTASTPVGAPVTPDVRTAPMDTPPIMPTQPQPAPLDVSAGVAAASVASAAVVPTGGKKKWPIVVMALVVVLFIVAAVVVIVWGK